MLHYCNAAEGRDGGRRASPIALLQPIRPGLQHVPWQALARLLAGERDQMTGHLMGFVRAALVGFRDLPTARFICIRALSCCVASK